MTTVEDVLAGRAKWCVIEGDSRVVVPTLPAACINAVVTDPPSGISFMGAAWDHHKGGRAQWVAWLAAILAASRVACVDGARLVSWAMPRTSHWTGCAIEDAGWTIETKGVHLFGTGWPKGKSQLKPAAEDWWLARTGASLPLNIDACRVGSSKSVPASPPTAQNMVYGAASERDGSTDGFNPNVGRYPPNTLLTHAMECERVGVRKVLPNGQRRFRTEFAHDSETQGYGGAAAEFSTTANPSVAPDGTETVDDWRCVEGCPVRALGEQSGETRTAGNINPTRVTPGYAGGPDHLGMPVNHHDTGTAARFFPQFQHAPEEVPFLYCAKASRAEKNAGCEATGRVRLRRDLTPEQRRFVLAELERRGVKP